jgi:hypothetical protein
MTAAGASPERLKHMFSFFALAALAIALTAGYRLNMYLYTQGAFKRNVRMMPPVKAAVVDHYVSQPVRELGLEYRDGTLRYARIGILSLFLVAAVVVIGVIVTIVMAL